MARFTTLIQLWERRVDAAREALGRTMVAIERAEAEIVACQQDRLDAVAGGGRPDAFWREQYRQYCVWSLQREAAHRHNLQGFQQIAERQRRELADARRRQQSFELLQQKEDERLARRERRREEAMLVEHAVRRWMEDRR